MEYILKELVRIFRKYEYSFEEKEINKNNQIMIEYKVSVPDIFALKNIHKEIKAFLYVENLYKDDTSFIKETSSGLEYFIYLPKNR